MRLGIIANTWKPRVAEALDSFLPWLDEERIPFLVSSEVAPLLSKQWETATSASAPEWSVDFVLSFGGDGTFLQTARQVAPSQTPIVGVNLGGFGYLAEVGLDQLKHRIGELRDGQFILQDRTMLMALVESSLKPFCALNDVVIDKGGFARTIHLMTRIDDEYLNSFTADGIIIATSTGSTGYSLSAGGPILEPRLAGIVINPICPHMLANRPLVVDEKRRISIMTESELGTYQLAVDGQQVMELPSGSSVTIHSAPFKTRVVHFRDSSFFSLLRGKLHWRDQSED